MENPDAYGHKYGPNSSQLRDKVEQIDGVIKQLVDNVTAKGMSDDVTIMIFSDHGMTEISPERSLNITG